MELAPTPAAAQRLRRAAVVTLLRAHRIRRLTADHVLAALQRPPLRVAPGAAEAASAHAALLIPPSPSLIVSGEIARGASSACSTPSRRRASIRGIVT